MMRGARENGAECVVPRSGLTCWTGIAELGVVVVWFRW